MGRKYKLYYDEEYDRLFIAGKTNEDVMAGSLRVINVILDFNTNGSVVNAEMLHASEYLESLGFNSKILKKAKGGALSIKQLRNGYEIVFIIKSANKLTYIPYNVHMPVPKQISLTSA